MPPMSEELEVFQQQMDFPGVVVVLVYGHRRPDRSWTLVLGMKVNRVFMS